MEEGDEELEMLDCFPSDCGRSVLIYLECSTHVAISAPDSPDPQTELRSEAS